MNTALLMTLAGIWITTPERVCGPAPVVRLAQDPRLSPIFLKQWAVMSDMLLLPVNSPRFIKLRSEDTISPPTANPYGIR